VKSGIEDALIINDLGFAADIPTIGLPVIIEADSASLPHESS
jgi:hypothetical protein